MNNNSNSFRISNEHLLLVNILNTMYNNNIRQINNITETLNNLYNTNNQIRNLLVNILHSQQQNTINSRRNGFSERRYRENNFRNTNLEQNRSHINSSPYVIDTITEYMIPQNAILFSRNTTPNITDTSTATATSTSTATARHNLYNDIFTTFMEPINVYPTQTQIETATRFVRYCDISRPLNTQCPISMDDFNDSDMVTVIRYCGHIFKTEHLMNWFRTNCKCPVCRYDIRNYRTNTSSQFYNGSDSNNATEANISNETQQVTQSSDTSNNIIERNSVNRMDIISNRNNSNDLHRVLSDVSRFTDPSGNFTDDIVNMLLLMTSINNSNNNRNY